MLFDDNCKLIKQIGVPHQQYYPQPGWVEHDAEEIYQNMLKAISQLPLETVSGELSIAITNQRETVVVWDRETGRPIAPAIVWQCRRTADACDKLRDAGYEEMMPQEELPPPTPKPEWLTNPINIDGT